MPCDANVQVVRFPHEIVWVEELADNRVDDHSSLQTETQVIHQPKKFLAEMMSNHVLLANKMEMKRGQACKDAQGSRAND